MLAVPARNRINPSHRIPSLDGLRAVSILIVLLSHASGTVHFKQLPLSHVWFAFGPFGVKVFFVISGFLITMLLLKEEKARGRISLGNFYFRRAFRILPVAYTFILTLAILSAAGLVFLPKYNLLFAATFTMNHVRQGSWLTGHLWSLSIEEQFYLVWPLVFLIAGAKVREWCCVAAVFIAPLLRAATYYFAPPVFDAMQESLLFMGDAIAMGCLLALWAPRLEASSAWRRVIDSRWFFLAPILAVASYATLNHNLWPGFYFAIGDSVCLVSIAAVVWREIHRIHWSTKFLNFRPVVYVGVLSYSLYVWQQIFLNIFSTQWVNRFPQNLLFAFAAAAVSYHFIETPFLKLRERISERKKLRSAQAARAPGDEAPASVLAAASPGSQEKTF
jgi:peptidoglycan/LPS O-acetylase OafA/YrhL